MIFFGHIGITAGVVKAGELLASKGRLSNRPGWIGAIDYRLLILGSILPDIIDKPLWYFTDGAIFPTGRDYAHTLLFNIILLIIGIALLKFRKSWLLVIASGSIMHILLDQIWNEPVTLWWPLLGPLQRETTTGWTSNIADALTTNPGVYIPEIIGIVIIIFFVYRLLATKSFAKFIKTGAIK